jgi:hypothetical protein
MTKHASLTEAAEARALGPGKSVYFYFWPLYRDGTPRQRPDDSCASLGDCVLLRRRQARKSRTRVANRERKSVESTGATSGRGFVLKLTGN